ncbi:hypothetical protein IVB44_06830 [Bradyrhizobium sp. 49]|nr:MULTISPECIES: hypothetical protein [unclassified Bradyrhizobium]MCK1266274.1 hypothetical protein [Bradyrhizobium sp. 84]MCK1370756.1 hypothetical protein [Bradyrhizobium sp. 49]
MIKQEFFEEVAATPQKGRKLLAQTPIVSGGAARGFLLQTAADTRQGVE